MCTVTFLPLNDGEFIFTSNRDESPIRETINPEEYVEEGVTLLYPKDKKAGGTWIGVSEKNRLVCLLNGGFEKHFHKGNYAFSRGVVVKKAMLSDDIHLFLSTFKLDDVEPFTLVVVDWNRSLQLLELVWDGKKRYVKELEKKPRIWSSSTLYTAEMKMFREKWFAEWLVEHPVYLQDDVFEFHENSTLGTKEISIKMKRSNVETVSTTSVEKRNDTVVMTYQNTLEGNTSVNTLKTKALVVNE